MMKIIACEQGSPEWFRARAGIPTASEFAAILTPAKSTKAEQKTRQTYLRKLAGEIITGEPMDQVTTFDMERGKIMEEEARDFYLFTHDAEVMKVGFIRNGDMGCSPDSLIGDKGMLEIKTKKPHLLIDVLFRDEFPEEHKAQCQGNLLVAEREWIDIGVYWPKMPLFTKRAYRDEPYIDALRKAIDEFNAELADTVAKVRALGSFQEKAAA